MLLSLLKRGSLLDEVYATWMFDVYGWSLRNFDASTFRDETLLVTPSNAHFPGRANNPEEMANLIFERVVAYAGLAHWPLKLLPPDLCLLEATSTSAIDPRVRGSRALSGGTRGASLPVTYEPAYVNNPEAMIAVFAHALAHYLGASATEPPPGGTENWPQITELLAVFLGFGLMFANTALVFPRGGCCGGQAVRRQAYVSQEDITYALAIFAALKGLPQKAVLKHLKKPLHGHFKRAFREVTGRYDAKLRELQHYLEPGAAIS